MGAEEETQMRTELARAIRNGLFLDQVDSHPVNVTSDFLEGLHDSFVTPESALYQVGMGWGAAFGRRLSRRARKRFGVSLSELEMQDLFVMIEDYMAQSGWGRVCFDNERFRDTGLGLIGVAISAGPIAGLDARISEGVVSLVAGFLAGILGAIVDEPLDGIGYRLEDRGVASAEIVVSHPKSIRLLEARMASGEWPGTPEDRP